MTIAECHPDRRMKAHGLCHKCVRNAYREALKLLGYPSWAANADTIQVVTRQIERKKIWNLSHREKHAADQTRYRDKMRALYGGRPDVNPIARARWAIDKNERREARRKRISRLAKDGSGRPYFKTVCELLRKRQWNTEA